MTIKRAILILSFTAAFLGPSSVTLAEELFILEEGPGFSADMCPPRAAATALNAYNFFLFCDRGWRKIGEEIRERAFAECLDEQKFNGVPDLQRQTANCEEIFKILERD